MSGLIVESCMMVLLGLEFSVELVVVNLLLLFLMGLFDNLALEIQFLLVLLVLLMSMLFVMAHDLAFSIDDLLIKCMLVMHLLDILLLGLELMCSLLMRLSLNSIPVKSLLKFVLILDRVVNLLLGKILSLLEVLQLLILLLEVMSKLRDLVILIEHLLLFLPPHSLKLLDFLLLLSHLMFDIGMDLLSLVVMLDIKLMSGLLHFLLMFLASMLVRSLSMAHTCGYLLDWDVSLFKLFLMLLKHSFVSFELNLGLMKLLFKRLNGLRFLLNLLLELSELLLHNMDVFVMSILVNCLDSIPVGLQELVILYMLLIHSVSGSKKQSNY